jgi:NitT/TauT family transport system ATP-binding protein
MSDGKTRLRIGYIPLVDAAGVIIAAEKGFAAAEDLDIAPVREVSWSNVRDKLNIGLFDAAHLLSPVAIASSLGIGHVRVPILAPFNLGLNGNAITVSPRLFAEIAQAAEGDVAAPMVTARALARIVKRRRNKGEDPVAFGMTFPFSTHNYQLRFWMAAGGIDPDDDVRLVVLPPPYMVESLRNGHVDGFCVGAPWNSVAVDLGVGHILHFVSDILARGAEKVLAVRQQWASQNPGLLDRLLRAIGRATSFIAEPANREGRMKISPDGTVRASERYLLIGRFGASCPDPVQAAWLYAQMVRWKQAPLSADLLAAAKAVFRPDLYAAALGPAPTRFTGEPIDGIGAFAGMPFDADNIAAHLSQWPAGQGR